MRLADRQRAHRLAAAGLRPAHLRPADGRDTDLSSGDHARLPDMSTASGRARLRSRRCAARCGGSPARRRACASSLRGREGRRRDPDVGCVV